MTLAAVRKFYFAHHVNAVVNGRDVVRDKNGPKRAWALLLVYMWRHIKQSRQEGAPKVGQFTLALQHDFMGWCRDHRKLTAKTISTYLSYIKAGIRFAAMPRLLVDVRGERREVRLLSEIPFIASGEEAVSKVTGLPRMKPRDWVPTDAELAGTIDQLTSDKPALRECREAAFRYVIAALNTIARPEAITDLSVKLQVNFDRGLIELNPPGRPQNKKQRPVIRLTDNFRGWLLYWNRDKPIVYYGEPVTAVNVKTLQSAAKRAGVTDWQKFNRYTLRHYMATRIKRVKGISTDREERAEWIGHGDIEHRQTRWYETMDPEYLDNVRRAIDAVMLQLHAMTKRSLFAPGSIPGSRLTVIENKPEQSDDPEEGTA